MSALLLPGVTLTPPPLPHVRPLVFTDRIPVVLGVGDRFCDAFLAVAGIVVPAPLSVACPANSTSGLKARVLGRVLVTLRAVRLLGVVALAATLGLTVCGVGGIIAQEEVAGVHARRVVAVMQDMRTAWDRAIGERPAHPVGGLHLPVQPEVPVTPLVVSACLPLPAGVWATTAVDLGPESVFVVHAVKLTFSQRPGYALEVVT